MTIRTTRCSNWPGRILLSIAIAAAGAGFFIFGKLSIVDGAPLLDLSFMALGGIAVIFALVFAWRGGRLGAEVHQDRLLVRHYFHDTAVPLSGLRRVYRSVDATVLEFPDRQFVLDDSYFTDSEARDSILDALHAYLNRNYTRQQ